MSTNDDTPPPMPASPQARIALAVMEGAIPEIRAFVARECQQLLDRIKELELRLAEYERHGVKYFGVYTKAQEYPKGAMVTRDGSLFVAIRNAPAGDAPPSDSYVLAVRHGKDGRDLR